VHLHAAFVPPPEVVAALSAIVAVLVEQPSAPPPEPVRKGLFGRRTAPMAAVAPVSASLLDVLDPSQVLVAITDLGYVAAGDAGRLAGALEEVTADLSRPVVRVSGGEALTDPEDLSVWATLAGDEDQLTALRTAASSVVAGVEPLGFYCDRRQYRPRLPLATINDRTTAEGLEQVLAALAAYDVGWEVGEVALLQRASHHGSTVWRTVPVGA
jgi:2'-5' RNA ligase